MKKTLTQIIILFLIVIIGYIGYQYYNYSKITDKYKNIGNINVELPEFYNLSINDTILATYILKTGYFQFDKNLTYDGIFNKNWIPLTYNFCNTKMGGNLFSVNDDFDNDGLSGVNDLRPFDYANGDISVRNSTELDFSGDGIVNGKSMDADGNKIKDIYQALCFDSINKKGMDQRNGFWLNEGNKFVVNKDQYLDSIKNVLLEKIPNKEIIDQDGFEKGIEYVYNRLLYVEDIIYTIDDKNYYLSRSEVLKYTEE